MPEKDPVLLLRLLQFLLHFLEPGYIPDRFNGTHDRPRFVTERGCNAGQVTIAIPRVCNYGLCKKEISFLFHERRIAFFGCRIRMRDQVNKDVPAISIKWQRIFIAPPAEHVAGRNPGHLLDCPVPCNDFSVIINGKRGIRQEVDDIVKPLLGIYQGVLD